MVGQSSGHRWRDLQRLVNPAKVIVHEVNRYHRGMVLNLFAERIGQPSKAAHTHAHIPACQIQTETLPAGQVCCIPPSFGGSIPPSPPQCSAIRCAMRSAGIVLLLCFLFLPSRSFATATDIFLKIGDVTGECSDDKKAC